MVKQGFVAHLYHCVDGKQVCEDVPIGPCTEERARAQFQDLRKKDANIQEAALRTVPEGRLVDSYVGYC